jgi:hypothetical protein
VEELDDLIRTYREKGCERAIDYLLECRLPGFFGMTMEEVSYAGALVSSMREVARQDMPVNKMFRQGTLNRLMASSLSPDYETDFSDNKDYDEGFAIDKV